LGIAGAARNLARRAILWPLLLLGREQPALAEQATSDRRLVTEGGSIDRAATSTLCLAYLGRADEARHYLDQIRPQSDQTLTHDLSLTALVKYLAAATATRDVELVALLRDQLSGSAVLISEIYPTVIARHLGAASALLGESEQARAYYDQAIAVCQKIGFRPELALSRLGLAELLLEHYPTERGGAIEHLNFAISEFREMKMQPALERALRHKDVLKA